MKRSINKVAVLGSGIMGSRIACHFANIGVKVLLLDIAPKELDEKEKAAGLELDNPRVRNRIVSASYQAAVKSKPSPLYDKSFASRVSLGNFEDDFKEIKDADWIIEVVIENLDIKKSVFEKVEQFRTPGTLVTSNTSGIPINFMLEERSDDFKKNFCGTHFFNPPRYLQLFEVIPTSETDQEVIDFLMHYGELYLGKAAVLCKDTPAFIANRIGIYGIMSAMHTIEKMELTVGEVDRLTGPIIGRAKSATFRTLDVVGLDTSVKVATNLYEGLPNDESRDKFQLPKIVAELFHKQWWGDKTKQGYFKKTVDENGKRVILELDLKTFKYGERTRAKFKALESVKDEEDLATRIKTLVNFDDKAGEFYRETFFDLFKYCSFRIPEIADECYKIDEAVSAGFGWQYGPFETWDLLGVEEVVKKMEEVEMKPNQWVYDMLQSGVNTFYKIENGVRMFYDINTKSYKEIPGKEGFILLNNLRSTKVVWSNKGATLFDIGDGIVNLEFHTKMNSIGPEVIEGITTSIKMAEKDFRGLVIANEGQNFSAGANLAMLFMYAGEQDWDEVNMMIAQFQKTMMLARFSSVPVISAPSGMALGGGCELSLHADRIQAHAETYMGLVEVGVGLIPAGGGTKEMVLRASDANIPGDPELNQLQEFFMNIATAKVSTSANEIEHLGYATVQDKITINRNRLIADAKATAINLADAGYTMPIQRNDIKVQGKTGLALFEAGIAGMKFGNYISDHDVKIAQKLSWVMNGGDLSYPTAVSEQYLLDLEREAFLSLTGEKKTLERIQSILFKGKPLRN